MGYQHPPTVRGYQVHEVISALQKAIRRSDVEAAVYWAVELNQSGHVGWLWNRLRVIAVEDVSPLAGVAPEIETLERWAKNSRDGGGGMELATAVIRLATAPKSRAACWGLIRAGGDHHPRLEIPDEALDRHTRRGLRMGRMHDHFFDEAQKLVQPADPTKMVEDFEQECEQHARDLRKAIDNDVLAAMPNNPIARKPDKKAKSDESWVPPGATLFDTETGEVIKTS